MDTNSLDASTYDEDYYGWTQQQAAHLRRPHRSHRPRKSRGGNRVLGQVSGVRARVALQGALPTIAEQRGSLAVHLRKNPGLKPKKAELFADGYEIAREVARAETGLPPGAFPAIPPFTIEEAEDEAFVPKPAV